MTARGSLPRYPVTPSSSHARAGSVVAAALAVWAAATTPPAAAAPRTVTVVAGERYGDPPGGQTWILGENYRALWTAPIEVEVLDVRTEAGGLSPVRRVGGEQTLGLAMRGADGKSYTFRSVDKDLTHVLPWYLRIEAVEDIAQDQLSATIPGSEVVAYPFARALDIIESEARLVVMPDDPALGEFREAFAGRLGVFLEFPQAGFQGTTEIQDEDTFWERRQEDPWNRPDSKAFLKARLLDLYLGDWDRHRGQWRWARVPGKNLLQPVPEDRDQVFCDFEGLAMNLVRATGGQMVTFEQSYVSLGDATQNGWDLDRFLLTDLGRAEWMAVARDTQSRLTNEVIEAGLRRLPPEYYEIVGERLRAILEERRDRLTELAEAFYAYLAKSVDVQASNRAEVATVESLEGGAIALRLALAEESTPYYERVFRPDETKEIRLYLQGGDDRVDASVSRSTIKLRVMGGPGDDLVDNEAGRLEFWDDAGANTVRGGGSTRRHDQEFRDPELKQPNENVPWTPSRDWGRLTKPRAVFGYHADAGVVVGGGVDSTSYGFRKYPWASRSVLLGAFAFGVNRPFVDYQGDFRRVDRTMHLALESRFSGLDQLRYYGLGNETGNDGATDLYAISLYQLTVFPALSFSRGARGRVLVGPIFKFSDSTGTEPDALLAQQQPDGFGRISQLGVKGELRFDSRVGPDVLAPGLEIEVEGALYPRVWDVARDFGSLRARLDVHRPIGTRLFLDAAVGGKKVWGEAYPFFEAAYLGGQQSAGGYNWNRFAGDASLFGLVDLKLVLLDVVKPVPGDLGVGVTAGTGRVWLDGETSSRWHPSFGAGVFFAPFNRFALVEAGIGRSSEKTFFIFRAQSKFLEF